MSTRDRSKVTCQSVSGGAHWLVSLEKKFCWIPARDWNHRCHDFRWERARNSFELLIASPFPRTVLHVIPTIQANKSQPACYVPRVFINREAWKSLTRRKWNYTRSCERELYNNWFYAIVVLIWEFRSNVGIFPTVGNIGKRELICKIRR